MREYFVAPLVLSRRSRLPLIILLFGGLLSLICGYQMRAHRQQQLQIKFMQQAEHMASELQQRMKSYEYGLLAASGVVIGAGGPAITRMRFHDYMLSQDLSKEFPGARGFGFIRRLQSTEITNFLNSIRSQGRTDFQIKQWQSTIQSPIKSRNRNYYVIEYIEPYENNYQALGLNIASEPKRRHAAEAAMLSGKPTLTAPITLLQANQKTDMGFLLLMPVYYLGSQPQSAAQRQSKTLGWVYAPLVISEVLPSLDWTGHDIGVQFIDLATDHIFYQTYAKSQTLTDLQHQITVKIAERDWQLKFIGLPGFAKNAGMMDINLIIFLMLLITVMIAAVVFQVIKNKKSQQKSLFEQQQQQYLYQMMDDLHQIMDAAPCGILIMDHRGLIREVNKGLCSLLGYSRESLLKKSINAILPERYLRNNPELISDLLRQAEDQDEGVSIKFKAIHQNGHEFPVLASFRKMLRGKERTLITSWIDISEQTKQEHQLKEAAEAAKAAAKSKSEFLANMSHEIRTPMNGIIGMTALALDTHLTELQRDYLKMVQDSANYLLQLINDILDFSKMDSGKLKLSAIDFQIRDFVDNRLKLLKNSIEQKNLLFNLEVSPDVPQWLHGDPDRWIQIVINFVSNALKFTQQGSITVKIDVIEQPNQSDETILLYCGVKDTGIGIPEAAQKHIFDAFTQADNSITRRYGGSGLGLSICRQVVELMNGRIWVDSRVGEGSHFQFSVLFNRVADENLAAAQLTELVGQDNYQQAEKPLTILLAEDHPVNQKIVMETLSRRGHQLTLAENGHQALERYAEHKFDLILMDVQMPGMDGETATTAIRLLERESAAHVRIIGLTAHALVGDKERLLNVGMDDYLSKPFMPQELIRKVEQSSRLPDLENRSDLEASGSLPIFNRQEALERALGELPLLKKLANLFVDNLPAMRADLLQAMEKQDAEAMARAAHFFKGSAGNFSAQACVVIAQQMEQACEAVDWSSLQKLMAEWELQVNRLIKELQNL